MSKPYKPTEKLKSFVREYIKQPVKDGQAAAIAAGCPPGSAKVSASRWLKNEWAIKEIAKHQKAVAKKFDVTTEMVLEGLYKEATLGGEGSTQAGRTAAWGKLGTFIGMDKAAPAGPNVNVTNNVTVEKVELRVEEVKNRLGEIFDAHAEGTTTKEPKPIN